MTKQEKGESQKEQSERFRKAVQDMINAGELNPTEADEAFEKALGSLRLTSSDDPDSRKERD